MRKYAALRRAVSLAALLVVPVLSGCLGGGAVGASALPEGPDERLNSLKLPTADGEIVYADAGVTLDCSNSESGYIMISCEPSSFPLKVRVAAGESSYYYDVTAFDQYETLPLQMGDGIYEVSVLEQVEGTTYSPIFKQQLSVELLSETEPFLYPNQYVSYDRDTRAVSLSFELAEPSLGEAKKLERIVGYIADNIEYDYEKLENAPEGYLPIIDSALESGSGICFDNAALLACMLRVQELPTKLIIGYLSPEQQLHAWNLVYIDGRWRLADSTLIYSGRADGDYAAVRQY